MRVSRFTRAALCGRRCRPSCFSNYVRGHTSVFCGSLYLAH